MRILRPVPNVLAPQRHRDRSPWRDRNAPRGDWHLVEGRRAVLVPDPGASSPMPVYFVLLESDCERIAGIRGFRHARYAVDDAAMIILG